MYEGIPHLFCPVVTSPKGGDGFALDGGGKWRIATSFLPPRGANIESYNQLADEEPLPLMVVIIDELED